MTLPYLSPNNDKNHPDMQSSFPSVHRGVGIFQGHSVNICDESRKESASNSNSKVASFLKNQFIDICQNNPSPENLSIDLKRRFVSLKGSLFCDLENLISGIAQNLNQTNFNLSEALTNFLQEIDCLDLNHIAKLFNSDTKLHRLFGELQEVKGSRGTLQEGNLSLPPLLFQLYEELKDWNSLQNSENDFDSLPPVINALFLEIEELAFSKCELGKIKSLKEEDIPLRFRKYTDAILNIKSSPTRDRNAAALAFATGFSPAGIMAATLSKAENLSTPLKFALAAAPIIVGSSTQSLVGNQADIYGGKKTVLQLLVTSAIGIATLAILVSQIEVSSLDTLSPGTLALGLSGIVAGAGLAVVPATFVMATPSGRASDAGMRQGIVGGMGTLSPGISNIIQAFAIKEIGMSNAYFLWLAMSVLGTSLTQHFLNSSIYHQLLDKEIPQKKAKEIALWLGQELFPNAEACSVIKKLKSLSKQEKRTMSILALNNVVSLGGLLSLVTTIPIHFTQKGTSQFNSLMYTGIFSIINSLTRTLTGKTCLARQGELATKIGLSVLAVGSTGLAFSQKLAVSLPFLGMTGIGMGISSYGLPAWLAEEVPNNFVIASGVGAMGGPVLALDLGALGLLNESEDTEYQFLLLPFLALVAMLCDKFLMPQKNRAELSIE
ncbi:MAG: nitrate/nitrite transporter NarK [Chlamydiales bacterium]|jgi:nitrate/nitrite transporter NarK